MLKVGDKVIIKNLDPNKVMKDEFVLMIGANNLPCYWDEHWLEVITDIAGVNDYDIDSLLRE